MLRWFVLSIAVLSMAALIGAVMFAPISFAPLRMVTASATEVALPEVNVWKSPTCGCCGKWAQHLRDNGFTVKEINARSMRDVKRTLGVGPKLKSCHTAMVGDYVIEGHVPASDIKRLLREKPAIKGLAVPGMPLGSPGMEQADGTKDKYEVLSFDDAGKTGVFERH